jgi:hypothetical protein
MAKSTGLSTGMRLLTTIIIIFFLVRAYLYTIDLGSCSCFYDKNLKNIENIEYLLILLSIFNLAVSFLLSFAKIDIKSWIMKHLKFIMAFGSVYVLFMLGLFAYFIYLINEFRNYINPKCECSYKWERYILYIQALYYTFFFFMLIFGALLIPALYKKSKK